MTLKQALSTIRALGLTMRKTDGEYRVNFRGAGEATAYYTNDIADAVDTARVMALHGRKDTAAHILAGRLGNAIRPDDSSAACVHGVRLSADCALCRNLEQARAELPGSTEQMTVDLHGARTSFEAQRKAIYDSPCSSYWLKEALSKFDHRDALDMARDVAELNRLAQLRLRELGL